jgi:hypothetical protein
MEKQAYGNRWRKPALGRSSYKQSVPFLGFMGFWPQRCVMSKMPLYKYSKIGIPKIIQNLKLPLECTYHLCVRKCVQQLELHVQTKSSKTWIILDQISLIACSAAYKSFPAVKVFNVAFFFISRGESVRRPVTKSVRRLPRVSANYIFKLAQHFLLLGTSK